MNICNPFTKTRKVWGEQQKASVGQYLSSQNYDLLYEGLLSLRIQEICLNEKSLNHNYE